MTSSANGIYDGIILGAGHNSLVLQAYLCRAGLKVLCIERRDEAGGGLTTEEDPRHRGFLHNTHSFYHRSITRMPWYNDLELERHGAVYLEPELNVALLMRDGRSLQWWTDFEKTADSFSQFSRKDAETLRSWRDRFLPIVEKILIPESQSPPVPKEQRKAALEKTREGRLLLQTSALSPLEFVLQEFEDPTIQAGLLFFNGLREVDLRAKGFGHHIASLLASPAKAQMCKGGSASLAKALAAAVAEWGGEIRLQTEPEKIVIENGRPVGVRTRTGEFIRARHFVCSGLNPQQTFLDLIDKENIPKAWRERAAGFRYNLLAPLFSLNVNLDAPPDYTAAKNNPALKKAFMVILGLEHFNQFPEIVQHHERGTIPPTVMWGSCPTQFDPSQAPPGKHTAFMWEKLPYRLDGDPRNWDKEKHAHGKKMLALWTQYAPNLEGSVIGSFTRSPLDIERTFPNMKEGDLLIGALSEGQTGYDRPFTGAGQYRGHVKGLYLCGSSSHPGGNITGLPGYNCSRVVLSDLTV
ncbi:MAG TPA: NAD(P)/FAD-dependent oxidoreductase [Chryseosolibacter sp.]